MSPILDRLILVLLGVWALVTGIVSVTNLRVEWMGTVGGFAALILGVVCLFRVAMAVKG